MPPARGTTKNHLEGPGDYDVTSQVHSTTYAAIDPRAEDFAGKAIFVSGGSRGIGRAIVLSFARAGVSHIAVGARSSAAALEADVRAAAVAAGRKEPQFLGVQMDVTDLKSVNAAAKAVEDAFGRLDVVVNNAGIIAKFALTMDSDPEEWARVIDVNIKGPYMVARAFLPLLLKGGDKLLVNVSSVAAHTLNPTQSAYQTSKAALVKFTQLLHREYGDQGLIAVSIHPGNCVTDMIGGPAAIKDVHKPIFVDTPELCGDTLVHLASKKPTWLGGRYINVTWDMPELFAQKEDIVSANKLTNRFIF